MPITCVKMEMFSPDADDVIQSQTKKEEQTLATLKIRKLFNQLVSPFPEMTFRFPPFYKVFGKDIMHSGRGGASSNLVASMMVGSTKVTLFSEIPFRNLSVEDKLWACYWHACVL